MQRVTLDSDLNVAGQQDVDIISLDEALTRLAKLDERMHRVVELRVFSGLGMDEIARVLSVSRRTVYDDWSVAKRWLSHQLAGDDS